MVMTVHVNRDIKRKYQVENAFNVPKNAQVVKIE